MSKQAVITIRPLDSWYAHAPMHPQIRGRFARCANELEETCQPR
jgi:hypothetical protein